MKKLITTALLTGALFNYAPASQKVPVSFEYNLGYESDLVSRVENVYFLNNESFNLHNKIFFGCRIGTDISFGERTRLNLGISVNGNVNDQKEDSKSSYNPEDYGPALSCETPSTPEPYASVHRAFFFKKNKFLRLSPYSEIERKLTDKIGIGLGCELYQEKIIFEEGNKWGDDLRDNQKYNLADLTALKPYTSLKVYYMEGETSMNYSIDFGMTNLLRKKLTNLGKGINFKFKKRGYFIGFRIGTSF